jgi:hypothetical protein
MREALLHIQRAIDVLRRSAGRPAVVSTLEGVRASLMHDVFGASPATAPYYLSAGRTQSDWTLGPDEPMPHHGETRLVPETLRRPVSRTPASLLRG